MYASNIKSNTINKITIQKNNPYNAQIAITDSKGAAFPLTGLTVMFTAKRKTDLTADDLSAVIKKDITVHSDPTHGITTLSLTTSDTNVDLGNYKGDLRLYDSGNVQINSVSFVVEVVDIVTKRNDYIS